MIIKNLKKVHKPKINSLESKSTLLVYGRVGIKALESGWLSLENFRATRHLLRRYFKKEVGKVWVKVFPEQYVTKKSKGNARMGKGKAALDRLIIYVKKGQIIFEIVYKKKRWRKENLRMKRLLLEGIKKFPIKCKIQYFLR